MVKSQRDRPGRAAGVCVCLFKPCNQVCSECCGEEKQNASAGAGAQHRIPTLRASACLTVCVLARLECMCPSIYRVKLARSACLHLCRELVSGKLISLMVLEPRWRSVHAARPPSWQRCCRRCRCR